MIVAAIAVAPDVAQAKEVADLVRRGPTLVERCRRGSRRAEARVRDYDSVGLRRTTRELGVAEQASGELADPDVEVAVVLRVAVIVPAPVLVVVIGDVGGEIGPAAVRLAQRPVDVVAEIGGAEQELLARLPVLRRRLALRRLQRAGIDQVARLERRSRTGGRD